MATLPDAGLHQEALADFILIRTDEVDEGERLRPVDRVRVQGLAATLLKDGQDTPIQVCRLPGSNRWTLVTGAHRRAAAELAGIEYLRAEVVTSERNSRRLREIRENLFAPDLLPIDRAAFVAELVQIKRAQAGLAEAGYRDTQAAYGLSRALRREAGDTLATIAGVYGWSKEVGAELGFSERTVRYDLELFRSLPASLVERLRAGRHPILSNAAQLRALVKLPPVQRERVVDTLLGTVVDGKVITSVARALEVSGERKRIADPETKRLSTFFGAFDRMTLTQKGGALAELVVRLTPGLRDDLAAVLEDHRAATEETRCVPADGPGDQTWLARHDRSAGKRRAEPNGRDRSGGEAGQGIGGDTVGVVEPSRTLAGEPDTDDFAELALLWLVEPGNRDLDPDWLIGEATRRWGGAVRFANGTYELKIGGIRATCTAGGAGLLRAWVRHAASAPVERAA